MTCAATCDAPNKARDITPAILANFTNDISQSPQFFILWQPSKKNTLSGCVLLTLPRVTVKKLTMH